MAALAMPITFTCGGAGRVSFVRAWAGVSTGVQVVEIEVGLSPPDAHTTLNIGQGDTVDEMGLKIVEKIHSARKICISRQAQSWKL